MRGMSEGEFEIRTFQTYCYILPNFIQFMNLTKIIGIVGIKNEEFMVLESNFKNF